MVYLDETTRTLWERSREHQADATNKERRGHIRDHMVNNHSAILEVLINTFTCTKDKTSSSALVRQIREAVELSQARVHCLFNSNNKYNRCILPSLKTVAPPVKVQEAKHIPQVNLSSLEGESALQTARSKIKNRVFEFREEEKVASKKIILN